MRRKTCCRVAAVLLLTTAIVNSARALAQPSAADKDTARALLLEGRAKLNAGDAQAALRAFLAAHSIMGVPTTGLDVAKAQVALGALLDARDTALSVTRIPVDPKEAPAFADARSEAAKLAEALTGRIPSLVIRVHGPPASAAVHVRMDGTEIPTAALTFPRKANPGEHAVEVSAEGYDTKRRTVTLKERQTVPVDITLSPATTPLPPGTADATTRSTTDGASRGEPGAQHAPGWAWGVGVAGLAALGAGVGFAIDYASVRHKVATNCPGNVCDRKQYDQAGVDALRARWNRDIGLTVGLGAVAVIGVGAAVAGIVAGRTTGTREVQPHAQPGTAIVPFLSARSVGVGIQGVF